MTLDDILRVKGTAVLSIGAHCTLQQVVDTLVRHNVGSLVVCNDDEQLLGIITERDILRACASRQAPLTAVRVEDVMSHEPITAGRSDDVESAMGRMTQHRIRHLPVVDSGRLAGMISIGDVVKAQHDALTMENHYLKNYLHG